MDPAHTKATSTMPRARQKLPALRTTGTNSIPTATETSVIASRAKITIAIAAVATGRRYKPAIGRGLRWVKVVSCLPHDAAPWYNPIGARDYGRPPWRNAAPPSTGAGQGTACG